MPHEKFDHSYFFFWYICICTDDRKISGTRTIYGKQFIFSFFPFHIVLGYFFLLNFLLIVLVGFLELINITKHSTVDVDTFYNFKEWKYYIFLVTLKISLILVHVSLLTHINLIAHFDVFVFQIWNDAFLSILLEVYSRFHCVKV